MCPLTMNEAAERPGGTSQGVKSSPLPQVPCAPHGTSLSPAVPPFPAHHLLWSPGSAPADLEGPWEVSWAPKLTAHPQTCCLGASWKRCSTQDIPCHLWNEFVGSQMGTTALISTPPSHIPCLDCALSTFPSDFLWSLGFLEQTRVQGLLCLPPTFGPRCLVPLTHTGILRDTQLCIWVGKQKTQTFPAGFVNLSQRSRRVLKKHAFCGLICICLFVCILQRL